MGWKSGCIRELNEIVDEESGRREQQGCKRKVVVWLID